VGADSEKSWEKLASPPLTKPKNREWEPDDDQAGPQKEKKEINSRGTTVRLGEAESLPLPESPTKNHYSGTKKKKWTGAKKGEKGLGTKRGVRSRTQEKIKTR